VALAAGQAAADSAATTQGFIGLGGLAEAGQLGAAATSVSLGELLANVAIAQLGINTLGLAGPLPGLTPNHLAYNAQAATVVNGLIGQIGAIAAAQAYLELGSAAMLANSGRRFLLSTYYGI